ncbi:MAG: hypothetical protein ACLRZZ_08045 [Enterocloster sp.]
MILKQQLVCSLADKKAEIVFSVVKGRRNPYFNMVEKSENYYKKVCTSMFTARQQAPMVYELNASIYVYRPRLLETVIEGTILDYKCQIIQMPDYLVLDIDSEEDFNLMSYLMGYFVERDDELKKIVDEAKKWGTVD